MGWDANPNTHPLNHGWLLFECECWDWHPNLGAAHE
jgi:hypothetical protein